MKKMQFLLLAFGLLFSLQPEVAKESHAEPKLKQIRTVFVKDEHNEGSQAAKANLEKWTCFKAAPSAEAADAVISVRWESQGQDLYVLPLSAVSTTGQNTSYRTTIILSIRDGSKFKKAWSKHIELGGSDEDSKSGVARLMENLKADACGRP
jgi:hypothetical protein